MMQIHNAVSRKMMEFQLSRLPQGSMGSRLIEVLGGKKSFCDLPVFSWKPENGPDVNWGLREHCYWDLRGVYRYEVKPEDLSHAVMRGKDSRGWFVLLLRKEVTLDNRYNPDNRYKLSTFPTVEIITPSLRDSLSSGAYLPKGRLTSLHHDDEKSTWIPHIDPLPEENLQRISSLLQGKEVKRGKDSFDTGYPSPIMDFENMTEKLK